MRTFLKHNSLSLVFLVLFAVALVLQAIAGHADFNEDQLRHGDAEASLGRYVVSSEFATAVLENWQSEYLQFTLFIISSPSGLSSAAHRVEGTGQGRPESDRDQRVGAAGESAPRWARARGPEAEPLRELAADRDGHDLDRQLGGQSITGVVEYNAERLDHPGAAGLMVRVPHPRGLLGRRSRTGSRSSSRWARWRSSPASTSASAAPRIEAGGGASRGHRYGLTGFSENHQWGDCNQVR